MTDLQTELAALIADAVRELTTAHQAEPDAAKFIAERLVSAFQQVAWRNEVGPLIDREWAEQHGLTRTERDPDVWQPVYRFVRPES